MRTDRAHGSFPRTQAEPRATSWVLLPHRRPIQSFPSGSRKQASLRFTPFGKEVVYPFLNTEGGGGITGIPELLPLRRPDRQLKFRQLDRI